MTTAAAFHFTPYHEYLALEASSDAKHEWVHGLVHAMSRGTPEHGRLSAAAVRVLPQTSECRVYSSDTLLYVENAQHSTYADARLSPFLSLAPRVRIVSLDERRIEVLRRDGPKLGDRGGRPGGEHPYP